MTKVLIIGASGSIGKVVRQRLLRDSAAQLTLFARHASQLKLVDAQHEKMVDGDASRLEDLAEVIPDQDLVFVALSGNMARFAQTIVASMTKFNVQRLIFMTTMGIYQEIPSWLGESLDPYRNPILKPFRQAANIIEASTLDYTIIRPGWYTNGPVDYELIPKGTPFGGHDVSRASIADYVSKLSQDPTRDSRQSMGINVPNK
ncbi:NAD(P)H-binding protein [Levilactobacillus sp. N40-8-2]|uniref:NAD(P)H-binding protein n=1 Tax=Levilactobacillus muriae TaxID=3238987 RepID=UPI0038B3196D